MIKKRRKFSDEFKIETVKLVTEQGLSIAALKMAITLRNPAPEAIYHSDRGVQYACGHYSKDLNPAYTTTIITMIWL